MKMKKCHLAVTLAIVGMTYVFLNSGCSTTPSAPANSASAETSAVIINTPPPLPDGVVLKKDKDIQGVWVAPGFNFKGYDTLYISNTVFKAIERPNEVKMRQMAMASLQSQLA